MSTPRRLALEVAYFGAPFFGYQRQPGFPTVQGELENAWLAVSAESVNMAGSGRTDSGVHARAQIVHFDTWSKLPPRSVGNALNAYLPEEIVVRQVAEVPAAFHASSSAVSKRYAYFLAISETRPVLAAGRMAWERRARLDLSAMREASTYVRGRHDFSAFAAAGRSTASDVRTLQAVHIQPMRGGVSFMFQGNGFLYKMVRNLVGNLVEVGRGRQAPVWMGEVLESRNRGLGAATAAPEGLYLWRVTYPDLIFHPQNHQLRSKSNA